MRSRDAPFTTRFAPAPTGFLHLGHIVNALYVWGMARAGGPANRVLLRIEDHDLTRSRPEFERAILEDLAWLGLTADGPPVRQSERAPVYESMLESLQRRGLIYACDCSRSAIAAGGPSGDDAAALHSAERRYPGTCESRRLPEGPGLGLRIRLEPGVERFDDWCHGPQEQRPAEQCGDMLVRNRDASWTYQFAVAVDDWLQGVTLVIRGDDLLPSTGRQIQLARLLGRADPPAFLHHPLVMKSASQKLSKSDGDTGIRDLRARGWSAEEVLGQAAWLGRLRDRPQPLRADAVPGLFEGGRGAACP